MYKAMLFDLDDTLYNYSVLNITATEMVKRYAQEELGISGDEFSNAYQAARQAVKKRLGNVAACHNRLLYFQETLEYLQCPPVLHAMEMYDIYCNYILRHMQLADGAEEFLQYLQANNVKIGICTDLTAHIQHRKIRKLQLEQYLDCLVTSEEVGAEKPNRNIFLLALQKLDIRADEVCYIGDSYEKDIEGALACGITAWLYGKRDGYDRCMDSFYDYLEIMKF